MKLIRNAIKCKRCGDIIESKSRHDFKQCSCKYVAVDGGTEDGHIIGNPEDYEPLQEWATLDIDTEIKKLPE